MIFQFYFTLLISKNICFGAELIKRPNGYFITGAGCGGDNPFQYLNYIPEDLEQNQCAFINTNNFAPSYLQDVENKIGLLSQFVNVGFDLNHYF